MFSSVPDAILMGSRGLLTLFFAMAALYFSWVLARTDRGPAARWFFRCTAGAIVVAIAAFLGELIFGWIYSSGHPIGMSVLPIIMMALNLLETVVWLAAAGALLRWASARKREAA
ncbi:MAG: hypothetical protein HKN82_02605 [Akkermansiaceae bacterium]|nr:hypothetical protein [Akkermansiaceae bacterium]